MDYYAVLLKYIKDHLAEEPDQVEGGCQPLITSGILDSLCLLDIQIFLEEEFGIRVPDEEMTVANFDTMDSAVRTLTRFA